MVHRHNRKQLDMSLSFRLSGLSSGAKLELVQLSRSPSVVTVALQLPESEARGVPNGRILDKFPSTTTLWLVLRKFEAGVAGGGSARNLTARGVPATNADTNSGRLFYEIPVLRILERELSSFTDLQKSLAQLGFNSGNILIRLGFRQTDQPLEEAMVEIGEYFKSSGDDTPAPSQTPAPPAPVTEASQSTPAQQPATEQPTPQAVPDSLQSTEVAPPAVDSLQQSTSSSDRPITVFSPPSADTPSSAQVAYNEEDYIPSIEHAQAHQRQLVEASRPQRLLSDAELAAKAEAEEKRRAGIRDIDVKVRLPDQSQVVAKFGPSDSGHSLYEFVRSCVSPAYADIKFALNAFVSTVPARAGHATVIPDDDTLLIKGLRLQGRVLVNFTWADNASSATHQKRTEILRSELRSQAQELKVEQPKPVFQESVAPKTEAGPSNSADAGKSGAKKTGGVPKWLKLPGKK